MKKKTNKIFLTYFFFVVVLVANTLYREYILYIEKIVFTIFIIIKTRHVDFHLKYIEKYIFFIIIIISFFLSVSYGPARKKQKRKKSSFGKLYRYCRIMHFNFILICICIRNTKEKQTTQEKKLTYFPSLFSKHYYSLIIIKCVCVYISIDNYN